MWFQSANVPSTSKLPQVRNENFKVHPVLELDAPLILMCVLNDNLNFKSLILV